MKHKKTSTCNQNCEMLNEVIKVMRKMEVEMYELKLAIKYLKELKK